MNALLYVSPEYSADARSASSAVDIAAPGVVIGVFTSLFASIVSAKVGLPGSVTITTWLVYVIPAACSLVVS